MGSILSVCCVVLLLFSLLLLRTVTMPIKKKLSHAKTSLSSFLSGHSPNSACMSLNCLAVLPCCTSLNCHEPSGCMTINCPPRCTAQSCVQSHDGPCDCPTIQMDSTTNHASLQNPCPDLDPSSSTDSLQTHDSLVTPESPPHLPSPIGSLEEGSTNDSTDTAQVTQSTQVGTTQVGMDLLTYDSLITALLRLSLEPNPDPLSEHQRSLSVLHHDSTSPPP